MNLHVDSLVDGKFSKNTKGIIILIFLIVPFISSIISMVHVVKFLGLGNTWAVSLTLAITYEIANLTILMAVVLMKKLRAIFVWSCFIVLLTIQIIGNIYYSYDYILIQISENSNYLTTFISFIQQIIELDDKKSIVFILSCFLGLPIPMVSLLLVKSVVDYLEVEGSVENLVEEKLSPIDEIQRKTESINFDDTSELIDDVISVINQESSLAADVDTLVEKSTDVINTEEPTPTHLGVEIRPTDDNNQ